MSNFTLFPVCARLWGFAPVWRKFAPVLQVKLPVFFWLTLSANFLTKMLLQGLMPSSCGSQVFPQRMAMQNLSHQEWQMICQGKLQRHSLEHIVQARNRFLHFLIESFHSALP